jgi:hypothetical protein
MNQLERRYRGVLRVLPAGYRAAWEEDMVATFLASVHTDDPEEAEYAAEFGRPGWSEVVSVLLLAVRLRLPGLRARVGGPGARPGGRVAGEALRLVALTGLVAHTANVLAEAGIRLWVIGGVPWLPGPPEQLTQPGSMGFGRQLWVPAGAAWSIAFVAVLLGAWRAAQVVMALALLPDAGSAVLATRDLLAGAHPSVATDWARLALDACLVLALTAYHGDTPPVRRRPWLVALAAGTVGLWGLFYVSYRLQSWGAVLDWPAVTSVAVLAAGGVLLGVPALRHSPRAPFRLVALAIVALLMLLQRGVTLVDYLLFPLPSERPVLLALGVAETVALLAVGVPLAVRAYREASIVMTARVEHA